jgi:hypothetical protein
MTSGGSSPQQAQQQVIDRANTDPGFRKRLIEHPSAALQEQIGVPLPPTLTIRVVEEQPGEVVLVLPAQGMASGTPLSEAQLEAAAGGNNVTWFYDLNGNCL